MGFLLLVIKDVLSKTLPDYLQNYCSSHSNQKVECLFLCLLPGLKHESYIFVGVMCIKCYLTSILISVSLTTNRAELVFIYSEAVHSLIMLFYCLSSSFSELFIGSFLC